MASHGLESWIQVNVEKVCSHDCGGGTQKKFAYCLGSDLTKIPEGAEADEKCGTYHKLVTETQDCNTEICGNFSIYYFSFNLSHFKFFSIFKALQFVTFVL